MNIEDYTKKFIDTRNEWNEKVRRVENELMDVRGKAFKAESDVCDLVAEKYAKYKGGDVLTNAAGVKVEVRGSLPTAVFHPHSNSWSIAYMVKEKDGSLSVLFTDIDGNVEE